MRTREKLTTLKKMLAYYQNILEDKHFSTVAGMCNRFIYCSPMYTNSLVVDIPEILETKPKSKKLGDYWWGKHTKQGATKRIEAITETIKIIENGKSNRTSKR